MFRYTISAPNPDDHLLHVRVELGGLTGRDTIDLSMPAWTPGSYLLLVGPPVEDRAASVARTLEIPEG